MLATGNQPFVLIFCVTLYGLFTAIVANLVFAVVASFADEIRLGQNMSMSEILVACLSLSSSLGTTVASGAAPLAMAAFGYEALAASQTASALLGIKALYIICTAVGMALSGLVMLLFRRTNSERQR
jgi:Na+/melibiose symporter-like transporter